MGSLTVRECFGQIESLIRFYKNCPQDKLQHEFSERCLKQDLSFLTVLFEKLHLKVNEVKQSKQLQLYIDKLKPLLKAEQIQRNIKNNIKKLHLACKENTVEAKKLKIQHIAKDLGLKYVEGIDKSYISFDSNEFLIEILHFDKEIKVKLIKENISPHEELIPMTKALNSNNLTLFEEQLLNIKSVFNIPLEPRAKPILYNALRALEKDLARVNGNEGTADSLLVDKINKTPIGYIDKTKQTIGIKLFYSCCYKLTAASIDTTDGILKNSDSCTISVECSGSNMIPTQPLYTTANEFRALANRDNAEYVEATFVVKLDVPLVTTVSKFNNLLRSIGNTANLVKPSSINGNYIDLLISQHGVKQQSAEQVKLSFEREMMNFFIGREEKNGLEIHRIPFTHPQHVPLIVQFLRQQATFNNILMSCHQPSILKRSTTPVTKREGDSNSDPCTIEVTYHNFDFIECMFVNPYKAVLTTLTIDLVSDNTDQIISVTSSDTLQNGVLTRLMNKYVNLPVVLHALLRILKHHHDNNITVPKKKEESVIDYETCIRVAISKPLFSASNPSSSSVLLQQSSNMNMLQQPSVTLLSPAQQQQHQQQQQQPSPISQGLAHHNNSNNMMLSTQSLSTSYLSTTQSPLQSTTVISPQQPFISSPTSLLSTPLPPIITQQHPPTLTSHSLPTPPDIIAQKRKRPIGLADGDGPKSKKPSKVQMDIHNIPSLSPMSTLINSGVKMSYSMRPIGPPTLKPAPNLVNISRSQGPRPTRQAPTIPALTKSMAEAGESSGEKSLAPDGSDFMAD